MKLRPLRPAGVAGTFAPMAISQRIRKFRKSNRTWDAPALPIAAGLLGGALAALAVGELAETAGAGAASAARDPWPLVWAFLFGFAAVGLPVLMVQKAVLRILRHTRALINIRPFTGGLILGRDLSAMDAVFGENLVHMVNRGATQIVEVGSGYSTLLVARRLTDRGRGHVTSLDHLEEFADRTRGWLRDRGTDERATVVHAPIVDHEIGGETYPWYDLEAAAEHLPDRIDLLVVDGPPGELGRRARWPAVPLLLDRLAPDASVLLDDGDRADETRIAYSWRDLLDSEIRYFPGGKGGWVLTRRG